MGKWLLDESSLSSPKKQQQDKLTYMASFTVAITMAVFSSNKNATSNVFRETKNVFRENDSKK